jgi:hypothetical protein
MRSAIVLATLLASRAALANPQPLVGIDDVRSQGPVALNHIEPSVALQVSSGPDSDDSVALYTLQLGLAPTHWNGKLDEMFGWTKRYGAHARFTIVDSAMQGWQGGPMTIGVHRYWPIAPLELAPLLHIHTGLSFTVATPWLSGRMETSPAVLQVTNGVNTELRDNGWSLRPLELYGRFDFLACRAIHVEAGGSPEAFVATAGSQPTSYNLRGRFEVGVSLGCPHTAHSVLAPLGVMLEYHGRTRLYQAGAAVAYYDEIAAGLQYNLGRLLIGAFYSTSPSESMFQYNAVTARVQVGFWGTR